MSVFDKIGSGIGKGMGGLAKIGGGPVTSTMGLFGLGPKDKPPPDPTEDARKRLSEELGKPNNYDQNLANETYQNDARGIDSTLYRASKQAAADYGKRGLSASGMASGQQMDLNFAAAAQKAAAKNRAIEAAKAVRRQGLMDEYGIWEDLANANKDKEKLKQQDEQNSEAMYWKPAGMIGSLL